MVNSGSSKEPAVMHLRRCLAYSEAKWEFHAWAEHIPGVENVRADALSRDGLEKFRLLSPQANQEPADLQEELLRPLMAGDLDWTLRSWTGRWSRYS